MARKVRMLDKYMFHGKTYEVRSIKPNKIMLKDVNSKLVGEGFIERTPEQLMAMYFIGGA